MEEVLEKSLRYAADNLRAAEEAGEGSRAVKNCCRYLEQYKEYKWRLPLMYDIQYLKQRKLLLLLLTDRLEEIGKCTGERAGEIRQIVNVQNDLLGKIYGNLQKGLGIEQESFDEMARLESTLAEILCIS